MALQEELERQGNFLFKYRGVIPFVFLLAGMAAFIQTNLNGSGIRNPEIREGYRILCLFVGLAGFGIRIYTVGHTPKNTSGRNTEGQLADQLNTTGIYSVVRHPLYLGNFLMWLGVALLTENVWFSGLFIFLYWVYYERIMFAEEQFLRQKFRAVYLEWAKNTPAFLPSFRNWQKPKLPFSLKKVLKKEKNGFFALFSVFFVFECVGHAVMKTEIIQPGWLMYVTAFSILTYLILKFLKKFTTVLDEEGR